MVVDVGGVAVTLRADRTVHWAGGGALFAADLHWGKGQTFRARGMPVPGGDLEEDLDRLGAALRETGARRLVVLGDLTHAREGVTPGLVDEVGAWRRACPVELLLVRGNHDRHLPELPPAWGVEVVDEPHPLGPFHLRHHPVEDPGGAYTWAGHVHPALRIAGARLPCFHLGPRLGLLPAFGTFTGSGRWRGAPEDRRFVVVEGVVVGV